VEAEVAWSYRHSQSLAASGREEGWPVGALRQSVDDESEQAAAEAYSTRL